MESGEGGGSVVLDVGDRKAIAPDGARSGKRRAQTTRESHPAKNGYGLRLGEDARGSEDQREGKVRCGPEEFWRSDAVRRLARGCV